MRKPKLKKSKNPNRPAKEHNLRATYNQYICQICGDGIITREICVGNAPPVIACQATDGCSGMMTTNFHRVPFGLEPSFEFYRPDFDSVKDQKTRDFLRTGGLLIRPIKTKSATELMFGEPVVVQIKSNHQGADFLLTFTFDAGEVEAIRKGKPLDWHKITNGASKVFPLPSRVRMAALSKFLENLQL
jgi:hypothetical protein